ncbi:CHAT domain-containing protein [Microbacterium sp. B2969]|uniref:CHAT domain-containing protein n=1 Tax=Microbacterium alkaliflavum TaxID=3248839 RepID=A0ABW7Q2B5_9MICO
MGAAAEEPVRAGRAEISFAGAVAPDIVERPVFDEAGFPWHDRAAIVTRFEASTPGDDPIAVRVVVAGDSSRLVALLLRTQGSTDAVPAAEVGVERALIEFAVTQWAMVLVLEFADAADAAEAVKRFPHPDAWALGEGEEGQAWWEVPVQDVFALESAGMGGGPLEAEGEIEAEAAPPVQEIGHALAEMPATSRVKEEVVLTVTLSRTRQKPAEGAAHDEAEFAFDPGAPISISVATRGYAFAAGTRRTRVVRLGKGRAKVSPTFRLVAVDPGSAEVTVVIRQRARLPLATLRVLSEIVADAAPVGAGTAAAEADAKMPDPAMVPLPTISIDESLVGGRSVLEVGVQIGEKHVEGRMAGLPKQAIVADAYDRIAQLRKTLGQTPAAERLDIGLRVLRALGVSLSRRLFTPEVRQFLWDNQAELQRVLIQTTGEFDIPWEVIYLSDPSQPVDEVAPDVDFFLGMRGATRWVYNAALPTTVTVRRAQARYLCPLYRDPHLSLDFPQDEGRLVKKLFRATSVRPGDADAMTKAIVAGFDLFHFGGHGVWMLEPPDQRLLFAAYRETGAPVVGASYSASDLRRDLPDRAMIPQDEPPRMVVLNACDVGRIDTSSIGLGGFPEAFLRGGVGVLIGCSWAVDDHGAGEFIRNFYDALANGTIADAVAAARRQSLADGDVSGLAYVAYSHPDAVLETA